MSKKIFFEVKKPKIKKFSKIEVYKNTSKLYIYILVNFY